jgi:hypothetical protein
MIVSKGSFFSILRLFPVVSQTPAPRSPAQIIAGKILGKSLGDRPASPQTGHFTQPPSTAGGAAIEEDIARPAKHGTFWQTGQSRENLTPGKRSRNMTVAGRREEHHLT